MSRLMFAPVPNGPLPLFIGEPRDDVSAQGRLCCDHASKTVFFRPADPFERHRPLSPGKRHRFSTWEIDAMMPRRQVLALYEEVKPLIERLDAGTALRLTDEGWVCTRTPEADVAHECIDAAWDVPADATVAWTPGAKVLRYFDSGAISARMAKIRADTEASAARTAKVREATEVLRRLRNEIVHDAPNVWHHAKFDVARATWLMTEADFARKTADMQEALRHHLHGADFQKSEEGPGSKVRAEDAAAYASWAAQDIRTHLKAAWAPDASATRRFDQFLF